MKLKNLVILTSALALLGNGCLRTPTLVKDISPEKTSSTESGFNKLNFYQESYSAEDRANWYGLGWPAACEQEFQEFGMTEDGGLRVYELTNNQYILSITCSNYAYQSNLVFMLVQTNSQLGSVTGTVQTLQAYNPFTKKLEPILNEDNLAPIVLGLDYFDAKNKTLAIFTKSRGSGDCGSRGTYKVIDNKITLIKYEAQSCEDADKKAVANPDGELTDWPVLYEKK